MNLDDLSFEWFVWFRDPKARVYPVDLICWVDSNELDKIVERFDKEFLKKALAKIKEQEK